jgi:hypothetical protein
LSSNPVIAEASPPATGRTSFESYGRLLTLLLPRMRNMAVHDGYANLIWSSPDWNFDSAGDIVRRMIAAALQDTAEFPALAHPIDNDRALYIFALRSENSEILAVVSLEVAIPGNQNALRPVETLRPFVQPAFECLKRELVLRDALGSDGSQPAPRAQVERRRANIGRESEFLDTVLKIGFEYIGCALTALWIPERNVSISLTPSGNRMSPDLLRVPQRQLAELMQKNQRTIIINRGPLPIGPGPAGPGPTGGGVGAYKILACPVADGAGRLAGVLAMFNPPSIGDFQIQQARTAELLARCIGAAISRGVPPVKDDLQTAPVPQAG